MIRAALFLLLLTPADYTVCTPVPTGPIEPVTPRPDFQRQPDFAAATDYPVTLVYDGMPPPRLRSSSGQPMRVVFGRVERCGKPDIPGHPNASFASCIRYGNTVFLPNPCNYGDREEFARLACHEQAHLAWRWPRDHGS